MTSTKPEPDRSILKGTISGLIVEGLILVILLILLWAAMMVMEAL